MCKLCAAAAATALMVTGVAYAQDSNDKISVKTSVPKGGSVKKPKPVGLTWTLDTSGANGTDRVATPSEYDLSWTGIRERGSAFPTCTADEIDAVQSDKDCNKAAIVGRGAINALVGPASDRTQNATCELTYVIYNAGAAKASLYASADPAKCAGIQYIPPVPIVWTKRGNTSTLRIPVPDNIAHPLPGVEGAFTHFDLQLINKKATVGKGKKKRKVGYVTSYGCGSARTRKHTFVAKSPTAPAGVKQTVKAGSC